MAYALVPINWVANCDAPNAMFVMSKLRFIVEEFSSVQSNKLGSYARWMLNLTVVILC